MTRITAALLLAIALGLLWRFSRRDVQVFARFATIEDSGTRQRAFLRWTITAFAMFLLQSLAGLALIGRFESLWRFPAEFPGLGEGLPPEFFAPETLLVVTALMAIGGTLGGLLAARRKRPIGKVKGLDIRPMIPRNGAEALCIGLLGSNAALAEEVFFRLYLPLLMVLVGVPAVIAFVAAGLIFALIHRYQGWLGVVMTGVMGAVFADLYLLSEGLLAPILFHLLINLNGLLLRPLVAIWARRGRD